MDKNRVEENESENGAVEEDTTKTRTSFRGKELSSQEKRI